MVLGALILGEYRLRGLLGAVAAVLFGVAIAEAMIAAARRPSAVLAGVGGALAASGFMWAAWIESGRDWGYVPGGAWVAAVVGGAASAVWIRSFGTRGSRSPAPPPHTPDD